MNSDREMFDSEREKLNETVMKYAGNNLKRFFGLDMQTYREGVLDKNTKELLGLVASFVLRCDDCIKYHLNMCKDEGVENDALEEALMIGVIVGGSITIPHLRRAFEYWQKL